MELVQIGHWAHSLSEGRTGCIWVICKKERWMLSSLGPPSPASLPSAAALRVLWTRRRSWRWTPLSPPSPHSLPLREFMIWRWDPIFMATYVNHRVQILHLPCSACMKHVELLKSGKDLTWWHPLTSRSIMQLPTRSSCKLKTRMLVLGLPIREHQFLPSAPNIYKKGTWRAGSTHGGVICQQGNVTDQTCLSAWDLKANLW